MNEFALEERLQAFLAVQKTVLASEMSQRTVMKSIADAGMVILPRANGIIVETLNGDEAVYSAVGGPLAAYAGRRVRISGSLFETCVTADAIQICDDVSTCAWVNRDVCTAAGVLSLALAPIHHEGAVWGVVKALAPAARAFGPADILALQILAAAMSSGLVARSRDHAFRELQKTSAKFQATFDQAAVGIAHVAIEGHFLRVNDRFCAITGHSRKALLRDGFAHITHPDDLEADLANVDRLLQGEVDFYTMEKRYVRPDHSHAWVTLTVSLVKGPRGRAGFFVAVIEDISARKAAEAEALRDMLTGLPNRRWLVEHYWPQRHDAETGTTIFAYLDLDGFKAVNDRFGHAEGDRCLVDITARILALLRQEDRMCRMAGDEFVLVLPNMPADDGLAFLQRLRDTVVAYCDGSPWTIGVSIGAIAVDAQQPVDLHTLLGAADALMYRSKRSSNKAPVIQRLH